MLDLSSHFDGCSHQDDGYKLMESIFESEDFHSVAARGQNQYVNVICDAMIDALLNYWLVKIASLSRQRCQSASDWWRW